MNAICSLMNRRAAAASPCRNHGGRALEERVLWRIARFPDEVVAVGRTQTARTRVRFGDRLEGRDGLQEDHEHTEGEVRARNDNGRQRRARRSPGPQILVGDDAVAEVAVVEGSQGVCQGARGGDAIGDDVRSEVASIQEPPLPALPNLAADGDVVATLLIEAHGGAISRQDDATVYTKDHERRGRETDRHAGQHQGEKDSHRWLASC